MSHENRTSSRSGRSRARDGRNRVNLGPTRTVMVFPTRDGDYITVTVNIGELFYVFGFLLVQEMCVEPSTDVLLAQESLDRRTRVRFGPDLTGCFRVFN